MKLLTHYRACLVIILFIASIGGCDARGGGIGGGMGRGGGGAGARQTKQQSAESPQEEETRHAEGPSAVKHQQRTRRQIPNMPSFPNGFPQPPKPEDFMQFPGRK